MNNIREISHVFFLKKNLVSILAVAVMGISLFAFYSFSNKNNFVFEENLSNQSNIDEFNTRNYTEKNSTDAFKIRSNSAGYGGMDWETRDASMVAMTVEVDATSTGTTTSTSLTISHTTTTSNNRLMLVGISIRETGSTAVTSITYNGVNLTKLGSELSLGARIEIWSLVTPASGTNDLIVNLNNAGGGTTAGVMTFTGVDQTTPLGAFGSNSGDATNGSATINSEEDELVFGVIAVKDADQNLVPGGSQTEQWDLFTATEANGGGSTAPGAATSVNMTWTWSASTDWAIGGVSIKPSLTSAQYYDEFTTLVYDGSDGIIDWSSSPWVEVADGSLDPLTGAIAVRNSTRAYGGTGNTLKTSLGHGNSASGVYVYREVDLSTATSATLSYYLTHDLAGADDISLEISNNGGSSWTVLKNYSSSDPDPSNESFDISAYLASNTQIRFYLNTIGTGGSIWTDNVKVEYSAATPDLSLNPTQDSYLLSVRPDENQGASSVIIVSSSSVSNNGLLQFDLSGIPPGVTITSGTLTMERTSGTIDPSGETIEVRGLTESWVEGNQTTTAEACTDGVTWDERDCDVNQTWSTAGGTYNGTVYASSSVTTGTNTWTVTSLVQEWVDGTLTNNGLLLKKQNSSTKVHGFSSRTGSTPPVLDISYSSATTINSRVNTGSDDAEENVSGGSMDLISSDLELISDAGTDQIVGMRFTNITVPQGATITNAYIEFEVDELDSGSTSVSIKGHDIDNSSTFSSTVNDISSRTQTTSSVSWNSIPAWSIESEKKQTPDITSIIQEIIDRAGWVNGNSLSIFIEGSGERTAESYEGEPANAPILYITFSVSEICNNGIDDDGDGLIDCLDPDCGTGSNIIAGCITVNSTGDGADVNPGDGVCADSNCECTLRAAIEEANALAGRDTICFNIPGAGVHIISPGSTLPTITDTLFIDGTTEPDFSTTPVVRIDGNSLSGNIDAFTFSGTSDYSEIRSLMITRFPRHGLSFQNGADYMTVSGNWIGTDGSGATSMGNANTGIISQGGNFLIGGTGAYDQNVIVNNNNEGISISGASAANNTIIGNLIGLEPNGISGAGNGDVGIALLSSGGGSNTIGGTTAAERNVISMNFEGIEISCPNNIIQGNYFGTDTSGTLNFGQRSSDAVEIMTGGNNNTIGGTAAGVGNLIAFTKSSRHGVSIEGGTGNAVLGNNIHSNTGMGINLGTSGVTANDSGDGDSGANNLQNYPVLSTVTGDQLQITITGTFNSANNTLYRIEFYASSASDATGYGEGERYLGTANVTTDGSGNATINAVINASVNNGEFISALSTDPSNNTSEFSATVVAAITLIEICNNSIDDDGDGLIDCADPDCSSTDYALAAVGDVRNGAASNATGVPDGVTTEVGAITDYLVLTLPQEISAGTNYIIYISGRSGSATTDVWEAPDGTAIPSSQQNSPSGFTQNGQATGPDGVIVAVSKVALVDTRYLYFDRGSGDIEIDAIEVSGNCIVEICNNGIDDDGDGLIDCADPDCSADDNDGDLICDVFDLDDDNDGIPDIDESGLTTTCPSVGGTDFPSYDYTNCATISGGHLFTNIGTFDGTAIDMTVTNLTGVTLNCGGANGCNAGDNGFSLLSTDNGEMATFSFFESGTSNPIPINWSLFLDDFDEVEGIRVDSNNLFYYILNSLNGTVVSEVGGQVDFQSNDNTEDDLQLFFINVQTIDIEFSHTSGARNVCFSSITGYTPNNPVCSMYQMVGKDDDGDGVFNHLDLDSDNDGIFDLHESGHSAIDADEDGIIDGAAALFGTNGLFDGVETSADSDVINYTISDSESSPNGIYDPYELDSDGDGCNDTDEENISDGDSDGIAGTGVPTVDANGLVTSITYVAPPNTYWQNYGLIDCNDSDCSGQKLYWLDAGDDQIKRIDSNIPVAEELVSGLSAPEGLALDVPGGKMYWTDPGGGQDNIKRANLDGTSVEILVSGLSAPQDIELDLTNGKMYWLNDGANNLQRANLDGTSIETLVTGLSTPQGLELDVPGGKMYWTDSGAGQDNIKRANLDGTSVEILVSGLSAPQDIELDLTNGKMYWLNDGANNLQRANLDGTSIETLVTGLSTPQGLELDVPGGKMYWTDSGAGQDNIKRANLDGTSVETIVILLSLPTDIEFDPTTGFIYWLDDGFNHIKKIDSNIPVAEILVSGLSAPEGLALDVPGGKMYWTDPGGGQNNIKRANLDGTSVEILVSGLSAPQDIELDLTNGKMYWLNDGANNLQRANLDGTSIETLVTGLSTPQGLELDVPGGKMYWTDSGAGQDNIKRANLDGTSVEILVSGLSAPQDIELDLTNGKMYWLEDLSDNLQRANLDGTSVEVLVAGLSTPQGLELDVPNGKMYWTDPGAGQDNIKRANLDGTSIEILVVGLNVPTDIEFSRGITLDTIIINESCSGENDGSIDLTVAGATAPITYAWADGPSTEDRTGLSSGIYTVTVTDATSCPVSVSVTVNTEFSLPAVSLTLPDTEECVSSTTLALSGGSPAGGSWSGLGVSGFNFDASVAGVGVHTITYTYTDGNGCTNTATDAITVYSLPVATLTLPDVEECVSSTTLALSGGSPAGGSFSGPGVSVGNFDASVAGLGKHEITYTYTDGNGCVNTATDSIEVFALPIVTLDLVDSTECVSSTTLILSGENLSGGTYSGLGVSGGNFDASVAGVGKHEIIYSYTDGNGCVNTATDSIEVFALPIVTLDLVDSTECINSTTLILSGENPSGGTFSGTGVSGGNFDASVAGLGKHEITYSYTDGNGCVNTATDSIEVFALPIVTLDLVDSTECVSSTTLILSGENLSGGTYSGLGVSGGNFDASVAGVGKHEITYSYTDGNGCVNTATDSMEVTALPIVTLDLVDSTECVSSTTLILSGENPSGGTYSGLGVSGGNFDASVAGVGKYEIIYSYTDGNGCVNTASDSIEVTALPIVTLDLVDSTECINSTTLVLSGENPSGGTFSGTGVSGGNFDASSAGLGKHEITYTYTDGLGCINTATDSIEVTALPIVTLDLVDSTECVSSNTLVLSGENPSGGIFSGTGVSGGNFDASVAGVGKHEITYSYTDGLGCVNTATDSIEVFALPIVSLTLTDDEDCVNNTVLTLGGGSPVGGTYSGTGVSGGNFNASSAGVGVHTITYTYTDGNGCVNSATDDLTVYALTPVTLTLPDVSECVTSTTLALSGGSPIGGIFSGLGVTGTNFDASVAGVGVHPVNYNYTDANGCTNTATANIVVFALPIVTFTLPDTDDCIDNNTFTLSGGSPAGGTYSGTGVTGTNFDAATAGLGTHTITYTYTDGNGCTNSNTDDITVYTLPVVSLTLGTTQDCINNSTLALTGGSPSGGTYSGTGVTGSNFDAATAGLGTHTITYTYTDGNGCVNTATDDITVFQAPTISTVTPTNPTTCSVNDGTITITAGSGTGSFEYRLNSGTWQASNSFTGLSTGSYNVFVRNDNGTCEIAYASNPVTLTAPSSPTAEINLPTAGCVGVASSFEATDAGVGATYSWDFGTGATPATATGIGPHSVSYSSSGSKNISLTVNLLGCVGTDNESHTVNALPIVSLNLTDTEECVSSTTLALSGESPTGGAPPGTFSGNGVTGTNFDASAAGVGVHTITFTYSDENGCINSATDDITVTALPVVSLTLATDEDCITGTTLVLSGGSPSGGTYSGTAVSGTNFDASTAGTGVHTITYTYTDGNGCVNTATDDITVYNFPSIDNISTTDPTSCSGSDGTITITASGGSGSFEYRLNSGSWQASNSFTGLSSGSYNVSVRNDNGLCELSYISNPVVLSDPPATVVTTAVFSNYTGEDISCVGESDGIATASGSGGTAPYTYIWSNGQTGDTLQNVVAGTYSVTVTDNNNCQGVGTITLNDPTPLGVNAIYTHVSCYGGSDGAIDVTATGGVGAYTYAWNDMNPEAFWAFDGNTDDITGNGHHAIYISGTEAYSNDAIDGNQSFHFDGNTRIRLDDDVSFLETPFNYRTVLMWIKPDALSGIQMLWDEGDKQNGIAFRLNNDKLQGTVAIGNQKRTAFELTFPNDGQWHEVGFVYDNGLFTLFLDGVPGTTTNTGFTTINMKSPPWNWNLSALGGIEWDDANGQWKDSYFSGLMDNVRFYETALNTVQVGDGYTDDGDRSGLPAGDYKVYVYDLNGCTDSVTLTITQPDSLALTANLSDVLCNGESNGEIDLVVAGGTAPFTYIWSTGATIEDIAGLSTGTYTVTVTDDNGCTVEDYFTINEPTVLTATAAVTSNYSGYDISCFGVSDGNASASPVGGTSPYTYLWSNGQTNANLTNVTAGTYTVTATDDNGCSTTASVTLNNPPSIIVNTTVTSSYSGEDISCVGASDGSANAVASAGVGSYTYLWSNGQSGASLTTVSAGTYTVTATDDNGCTATGNITLDDPSPIVITTSVTSDYNGEDVSCPGDTDGSADASASGGIGSFTYLWSNGQTSANLTGVGAGTYTVTATDAFSCTSTQTVTLVNPSTVGVTINKTSNYNAHNISCVGASDGNATATGSGGVSGYTYLWSNGQSTANLTNVKAGTYTVTTTDANGCTSVASVNFSNPPPLNVSITSADPSDCGIDDGIILVTTSGGVGTYEYSLDGLTYQSSNSFSGLGVGTYFVYVRNTYGTCVKGPTAVFINYPEAPTIDNITIINPTTGVSTDGGILVSASGNGLAIEYSLDGISWQSSNLFSNLSVGTYNLEVRYTGLNCLTSSTVTLTAGGGVVGSGGGLESYCSDDLSGVNFVEVYYIPFPEDQVLSSLLTIAPASCGLGIVPSDPIQTYVSIGAVEDGTIIYYDHWEDGFETNLAFPVQSTTEVWGDGNVSNGIPPGYTVDILSAASIIVLDNAVVSTTRAAVIDFDGGDKIASRGNLAITRLAWADQSSTLLAGALEVYPTVSWGTNFEIPVGANTDVNQMFEYTGATIMASQNNTIVNIDSDGDGTTDVTTTLNEGESYMQNGGFFSGGSISTSAPVQVGLITGDNCVGFESRFFTLKSMDQWSDNYYNPVSTMSDGSNGTNNSNRPTYVHLYNPNSTSIDVYWDTDIGNQGFVSVPAKGTNFIELPEGTGSNFYTTDNSIFYAIATIDSDPDGSSRNSRNDWGFALMPESQITSQITLVGFAPGQDPTNCTTGAISKSAWNIQYVDSEETVAGTHPATNAIDDNNNTFWHSKWDGGSDPLPHEIQIDLGATHDINGFSYLPRQDIASPTTNLYASTDVPKTITTSGTPTITSTLTVAAGGMITDIDVINLDITHEEIKELTVTLTSPSGTSVVLLENPCDKDDDIYMSFDDEAASGSFPCPPIGGLTYQPFENLSDFDGEISTGTWTLTIEDNKNNKGGSLNGWSLNMETGVVSTDGNIADYEFYVSADGVSWGAPRTVGTWASGSSQQTETFPSVQGRYVRLVATSEVNGNPWTSIAELDVMECAGGAENSAPVWLTADFPSGSTYSGNITVCIDYNGDGGSITDANGVKYDATVVLTSLQNAKIYDPDGNQTGMRLWVCDGTDAVIAGAWGQDPATASPASPAIDLGVGLPNGIPFATSKCVDLSKDFNSNGLFNECDEVVYTIIVRNSGVLPLSVGALNIRDTLPSDLTYIENSTTSIINGVVTNISDDSSPASAFPLDEMGLNYSAVILPKDSIILRFEASINDLTSATFIRNVAHVVNGSQELFPEVSFPALEPIGTILTGVPTDTIVECSDVPSPPIIGTDIRAVNNCEEMDTIPQAGWSLYFVDSEDVTSGELAVNAFDGDPNTIWSTQWNGADPIHPHEIQIDLGATYTIGGFRYLPRQIGNNGRIGDFEIYVSSDGISWGTAAATGTWSDVTSEQEEIFNLELGRYIRLVANSEVNGNPWTAVSEINILQCVNYAPVTIDFSETSTQTNDGSATDDCYNITRTWETTDHCGEVSIYTQNITVTDTVDPVLVDVPEDITVTTQTIPDPPTLNCSSPDNLALGKPTTQSSTAVGGDASNAVDGNTDGDFSNGSVTQTNSEVQPWWEIDLQKVASIDSIEVWNRTDCCASNLSNYYVLISDIPFASTDLSTSLLDANVKSFFDGTTAGSPTKISIDTTARYIRIQLQGTAALSLTEVVVTQACVSATDNCDTDATVTYSEVIGGGACTYDITRTWTATDNCGNTSSESQVITVSSILLATANKTSNFNGRDISCVGASDGAAEVIVSGGVAPITFNWSDGQTTASAINLIAGTYTVTVSDGNGCTAETNVTLQNPPSLTVGANITSNHNGEDISCFGANDGSVFANASGGTGAITYAWSSGQNVASATGLVAGTYTVTATDNNGCTSSASITLNEPTQLTISASVTSDYNGEDISCPSASDGEATAVSSGGSGTITYSWSNSQTGTIASTLVAGTYTVTATDGNGCIAISSVTLNDPIIITPSISASSNPTLCEGTDGSITISASGGMGSYEYKNGIAGTWQGGNIFSSLSSGTYDFYVRNNDGTCEVGPISEILDDPIPQSCPIIVPADTLIYCNSDLSVSFKITTSPDATGYTWTAPVGTSIVFGQGTDSIVINMNEIAVGSYDVCVVTNSNCGDSPACCITIELVSCAEDCSDGIDNDGDGLIDCDDPDCGFSANAGSAATICNGASTNLSASGGTSYAWSPATGLSATNISNPVASPSTTTTYTVTVTDGNGCTATDAVIVNVNSLPTANAGSDATICDGASTNLLASGGTSYAWSPATGLSATNISNPVASPTSTTTYTVTVTDGNSCTSTDAVTITVNALPTADAGSAATICNGASTNLSASGGVSYAWSPSTGLSATNISNPVASPTTTTTYTVTVTDGNSCTSTDAVTITVNALPTADAGSAATICNGASTNLSASGGVSYAWSPSTGLSATNISNPVASPTTTTTYTVTVTDGNSCTSTDAVTITVNALPTADAGSAATICNGASTNLSASGGVSYAWSPSTGLSATNISNPIASPTTTTTYTVTVTDGNSCTSTDAVIVNVNSLPTATITSNNPLCPGDNLNLTVPVTASYSWTGPNGFSSNQQSPTINSMSPTEAGLYSVTVTNGFGCTASDNINVTLLSCTENCTNGIDDDGDGLIDCNDSDCTPIANNATLNTCDNSNMTGSGTFFLHDANPTVSSESGVMISYHPTLLDAQNATNILISPYTSADATVYSRVERVSTGCFATSEITLDVGAKCAENCNNGKDEDGDGLIDCEDTDCPCCDAYAPTLNGLNKKDP